jgi:hypothetical protein
MCLDGYVKNENDECVPTEAPTAVPSMPPTVNPTQKLEVELSEKYTNMYTNVKISFTSIAPIPADGQIELDLPPIFQDMQDAQEVSAEGIDGTFTTFHGHRVSGNIRIAGVDDFGEAEIVAFETALNATFGFSTSKESVRMNVAGTALNYTQNGNSSRRLGNPACPSAKVVDVRYAIRVEDDVAWGEKQKATAEAGLMATPVFETNLKMALSPCAHAKYEVSHGSSLWIVAQRMDDGTAVPAGVPLTMTFAGVQNPGQPGRTPAFEIKTSTQAGQFIDEMEADGELLDATESVAVVLSELGIGETSEVTITLTSKHPTSINGKLQVEFPETFTDITNGALKSRVTGVDGAFEVSVNEQLNALIVARTGDNQTIIKPGVEMVWTFTDIINPGIPGLTPNFECKIMAENGEQADYQTAIGSFLVLVPTNNPTPAPSPPTPSPSLSPTIAFDPSGPCATFLCDTQTSVCQYSEDHEPLTWCQCLDGFVLDTTGQCVPTIAPTMVPTEASVSPTLSPTSDPTLAVCEDGAHGCDPASTRCVELSGAPSCQCLLGFDPNPEDLMSCLTASPTSFPTSEVVNTVVPTTAPTVSAVLGTESPTLHPTHIPSAQPTFATCADGNHGCDTTSTFCTATVVAGNVILSCQCLDGFIPDPHSAVACMTTVTPTSAPTHMPTLDVCTDNSYGCDHLTTICVLDPSPKCQCKEGFITDPSSDKHCLTTPAPSMSPTSAPSWSPTKQVTPEPTHPPTLQPTSVPSPGTIAPSGHPTWRGCTEEDTHGCNLETTRCVDIMVDTNHLQECECLVGFVRYDMDDLTSCEPIEAPSSPENATIVADIEAQEVEHAIEAAVPTPEPPVIPVDTQSGCDPETSSTEYRPFCKQPDRNLSIWVLPGTASERCLMTTVAFDILDMDACADYCASMEGGPPRCNYLSYNPFNLRCRWSMDCEGVMEKEIPAYQLKDATEEQLEVVQEFDGIMQLFCSYNRNLLDVCKWAVPNTFNPTTYYQSLEGEVHTEKAGSTVCSHAFTDSCSAHAHDDHCTSCITDHLEAFVAAGCEATQEKIASIYCAGEGAARSRKLTEKEQAWADFYKEHKREVSERVVYDPKKTPSYLREDALFKKRQRRALSSYKGFKERSRRQLEDRAKRKLWGKQMHSQNYKTMSSSDAAEFDFSSLFTHADDDHVTTAKNDDNKVVAHYTGKYNADEGTHFHSDDDEEDYLPYEHGPGGNHSHHNADSPHPTGHFHTDIDSNLTMPMLYSASGLTECFNDCTQTSGCELYAFNPRAMKCALIGGSDFDSLITGCERLLSGTVHQTAAQLENDFPSYHAAHVVPDEKWTPGLSMPEWAEDIFADFSIYMRHETHYTLFNEPPSKYKCDCKPGFHPHPSNWSTCLSDNITVGERCTQVVLEVAKTVVITASAGDDDSTDFDDISLYEDCRVFFDCGQPGDQREQYDELSCTIHDGECSVPRNIFHLEECDLVLDIDAQTNGYECRVAGNGAGQLMLSTNLKDHGLIPPSGVCGQKAPSAIQQAMENMFAPHMENETFVFSPGPEDPEDPNYANMGFCALCWTYNCFEIEDMVFNTNELSGHQTSVIAWDENTFADTLGACFLCHGDSGDPNTCMFSIPEERAELWSVCDDMCKWSTCEEMKTEVGGMMELNFGISQGLIPPMVHRIVTPLCWGCNKEDNKCTTKPEGFDLELKLQEIEEQGGPRDIYEELKEEKMAEARAQMAAAAEASAGADAAAEQARIQALIASLPTQQQAILGFMSHEEQAMFISASPDEQMQGAGFSQPPTPAPATPAPASGPDPMAIIMALPPQQQQIIGMMSSDQQEAFFASSPAEQMAGAGFSLPPTPAPCGPPATPMEIIMGLPADQQQIVGMMPPDQQAQFFAASPEEQKMGAGFSLPPQPVPCTPAPTAVQTTPAGGNNIAAVIASLPAEQQQILGFMSEDEQAAFFSASPADQMAGAGFSLPPTPAPGPGPANTMDTTDISTIIASLPADQQQIIGFMSESDQASFFSAPPEVQMQSAGFSLPPTPAPPTPTPPTPPAPSGGGQGDVMALIGSLPAPQQAILGAMAPAQQQQFLNAPPSVQMSSAGFSLPPTPAPATPAPPTAAPASSGGGGSVQALIASLPASQQAILGAMAPAQQQQFLNAPPSVQMSSAGFSLPPTPAAPTPAPPSKAPTSAPPASSGGGSVQALIASLPASQQAILGGMAPAQQAQFIGAPASVQMSSAGFSLPPTPGPQTPSPTTAPPTAAPPTVAPGGANSALIASLPLQQQAVLNTMPPVQQAQFIGAPSSVQMSSAGFSLPPTPAPTTAGAAAASGADSFMASLNAQEKVALQHMNPAQQASFAAASPEERAAMISLKASTESSSGHASNGFLSAQYALALSAVCVVAIIFFAAVVTLRRRVSVVGGQMVVGKGRGAGKGLRIDRGIENTNPVHPLTAGATSVEGVDVGSYSCKGSGDATHGGLGVQTDLDFDGSSMALTPAGMNTDL